MFDAERPVVDRSSESGRLEFGNIGFDMKMSPKCSSPLRVTEKSVYGGYGF